MSYIGTKKVNTEIEAEDGKIKYTLEDNSGDTVTHEQFTAIVSENSYDDGMVRIKKWMPAVKEIMEVLLKNDMKLIEKDFIMGRVDATIIENYQKASARLFGAQNEAMISLSQIHKVLINKETTMSDEEVKVEETPVVEVPNEPAV